MSKQSPLVFVLRCGGAGTRLWPVSRQARPKQFQQLFGEESLFERKVADITPLVKRWEDVFVTTAESYVPIVRRLAPKVPIKNIIAEPCRRNTGSGVALETVVIAKRYPKQDPIIVSLTVDDVFQDRRGFQRLLSNCIVFLRQNDPKAIVTIGCRVPPDPGLSYFAFAPRSLVSGQRFHEIRSWVEKPHGVALKRLHSRKDVAAHTGLYIWRASTVLGLLQKHHSPLWSRLERIQDAAGTPRLKAVLRREFPAFPNVSVEELLVKHAPRLVGAVADLHWRDTGKWFLVHELQQSHHGASVLRGNIVTVDTKNSYIYAPKKKIIGVLGVEDLVIVDTPDALLVCPKNRSADLKLLTDEIERRGWGKVLL